MNMDPEKDHLPLYFNSAEKWPGKIHEPLDQGNCAASWAFSTAGRAGVELKDKDDVRKKGQQREG